jgi:hypothetical protein
VQAITPCLCRLWTRFGSLYLRSSPCPSLPVDPRPPELHEGPTHHEPRTAPATTFTFTYMCTRHRLLQGCCWIEAQVTTRPGSTLRGGDVRVQRAPWVAPSEMAAMAAPSTSGICAPVRPDAEADGAAPTRRSTGQGRSAGWSSLASRPMRLESPQVYKTKDAPCPVGPCMGRLTKLQN